jgi:ATP-dependent protease ClpP protease subunit
MRSVCSSVAAMILVSCTARYAGPVSTIVIHTRDGLDSDEARHFGFLLQEARRHGNVELTVNVAGTSEYYERQFRREGPELRAALDQRASFLTHQLAVSGGLYRPFEGDIGPILRLEVNELGLLILLASPNVEQFHEKLVIIAD